MSLPIFTIGHSTRPLEEFIEILQAHQVTCLIDVRTIPRSRTNPQYNRDTLRDALAAQGITYLHEPRLGGLRHTHRDSVNTGWRNLSFRGFADYMSTPEFAAGIDQLISTAETETLALMCAEAVPWRCHRSLIADALLVRGLSVNHIMSARKAQPHKITPFAQVRGRQILYPA